MGDHNRARVEMRFADGETITQWESLELHDDFTDPLGRMAFTARPRREDVADYRERLAKGELVTVLVNGALQGAQIIQSRRMKVDKSGVTFAIECHTPLVTAYQSHVDPTLSFKSKNDAPVSDVVLKALSPFGFSEILADAAASRNARSGKPIGTRSPMLDVAALKTNEAAAQDGEKAYSFCARIFNRMGVALRCDPSGRLLLQAPDYDQEPAYTVSQTFGGTGPGDRFLDGLDIEDTNDEQFSSCTVSGLAPDKRGKTRTSKPQVEVVQSLDRAGLRAPYTSSVAPYKPLIIKDKSARDAKRCENVATLAMGIRAGKAYGITGEVDGFVASTGRVWTVDTIARVVVEADAVDESMYLVARTLMQSRERGQTTRLRFIPRGALVLGEIPSGG